MRHIITVNAALFNNLQYLPIFTACIQHNYLRCDYHMLLYNSHACMIHIQYEAITLILLYAFTSRIVHMHMLEMMHNLKKEKRKIE